MRRILPWIIPVVLLTLLGVFIWVFTGGPYAPFVWLFAERQTIQVWVPAGYEGPALIAFEIPDGVNAEKKDAVLIYRLEPNGTLFLKDKTPTSVIRISFWYVQGDGTLQAIPQSDCFSDSTDQGIVVCGSFFIGRHNLKDLHPNEIFYITRLADQAKRQAELEKLLDRYENRLALTP
ncbi:MAG: hypothetical protein WCF84_06975 [Anaerolineae bacterium]